MGEGRQVARGVSGSIRAGEHRQVPARRGSRRQVQEGDPGW